MNTFPIDSSSSPRIVIAFVRTILCLAVVTVTLSGCMDSNSTIPPDLHVPANATLQGLLPDPTPMINLQFTNAKHYALSGSSLPPLLTAMPTVRMEPVSALRRTVDAPAWAFGLGREELEVKLGSAAVVQAEKRLADYYARLFDHASTDAALRTAVQSFPHWVGVDTDSAQDLAGLRIDSVTLSSGESTDEDGNGDFETPQTMVTVTASLPNITLPTPTNALAGCTRLLADTASVAQHVEDTGITFIAPSAAAWQYRLTLTAHFYVAGLHQEHATLIEPGKGYLTMAQVAAAARNLGLFSHLLGNLHSLDIPSSDLLVSFVPAPALHQQTFAIISGMARTQGDADCLRDVDTWEANPSIIHAGLSPDQLQGRAPPDFLLHTYNATFDALDGVTGEFGTSCLHDKDGKIVQIGEMLACATASGPIELESPDTSSFTATSASLQRYRVVTPYQRIEQRTAIAQQCDAPVSTVSPAPQLQHVKVGDFVWTCTSKYAVCSRRFGRGNRVCMSEWLIHNQVGDYWNIHWTQNPWKSSTQSGIKAGAYVVRAVVSYYVGGRAWSGPALESMTYLGDVLDHALKTKIAGHSVTGIKTIGAVVYEASTKLKTIGPDLKNAGIMFAFDKVVDMTAQIAEVEAVGWQDYANGSHCACGFEFRHPNYCS